MPDPDTDGRNFTNTDKQMLGAKGEKVKEMLQIKF